MNTRRDFLQLSMMSASALLTSAALVHTAQAQSGEIRMQALNDSTALFTGSGSNVLAKKSAAGELLVVDGGNEASAGDLRRSIEKGLDSKKFATLINTHWHPEQTGLNLELGNKRTRIFAHENTRQWLSTDVKRLWQDFTIQALPEKARPNDTFYHYGDFSHGNDNVEFGYLRQAHTDGDMYVFLPEDNILHAGGVFSSNSWPFLDWWTGGVISGLVDGVDTLLSIANDDTLIIPAHGPAVSKAELISIKEMYADVFNQVRRKFMEANTVEQTVAEKPAAAYEAQYGNADDFVELAHWSLIPHLTPDA